MKSRERKKGRPLPRPNYRVIAPGEPRPKWRELTPPPEPGELRELSDEHYMLLGLELANWGVARDVAPFQSPDVANVAFGRLTSDTSMWTGRAATLRTSMDVPVADGALKLGKQLRADLESFMQGGDTLTRLRAHARAAIDAVDVRTQLHISERGVLEHRHSYTAEGTDGPRGLFLAFLLDPNRRFGRGLKQCLFCRRFFFVPPNRKGGPIPSYCPGTDHQRRDDNTNNAPRRVQKFRERQAEAAKRTRRFR